MHCVNSAETESETETETETDSFDDDPLTTHTIKYFRLKMTVLGVLIRVINLSILFPVQLQKS